MTTRKLCLTAYSLMALGLPLAAHAQSLPRKAPAAQGGRATPLQPADAVGSAAADRLRRVESGYRAGLSTAQDVSQAQTALDQTRLHTAIAANDSGDILPILQSLQSQQQQRLNSVEAQNRAGIVGSAAVNQARLGLAEARSRVDLYTVVTLRKETLAEVSRLYADGIGTVADKGNASAALKKAQELFAQSGQ